jgi:tetratricopeptide (TPR) repeat protein
LSDTLCTVGYFEKALELLEAGLKECKDDPILHELIARVAFIMENFKKCITHNKKAAELQPDKCFHNNSDIGLAYYRLGLQAGDSAHFETAFDFCRKSLQQNQHYANAMVNMGLVYRHQK